MASLDDPGDVREGFLCPLCLKDLQSFYQLQSHYEEEHSGEDRDVKGQIKSKRPGSRLSCPVREALTRGVLFLICHVATRTGH
uniref:C2H2-type domain-containing protein n=1 Tax=Prolemur simus TaxID=1328070 RepID=A0A8C8ZAV6_PROSS